MGGKSRLQIAEMLSNGAAVKATPLLAWRGGGAHDRACTHGQGGRRIIPTRAIAYDQLHRPFLEIQGASKVSSCPVDRTPRLV